MNTKTHELWEKLTKESNIFFVGFILSLVILVVQDRSLNMDCSTDEGAKVQCPGIAGQPRPKKSNNLNHALIKKTIFNTEKST